MTSRREASQPPVIPGYTYVRLLGMGGFADVFLYRQQMPRRQVAVKVLLAASLDDAARARFRAEADIMASLSHHPSIVTVYQADVASDGRPYLVMEYCSRPGLAQRYRAERMSLAEVLRIGIRLASAVETAHRAGVLHRDIKPANVLVTDFGWPALTDFGIAATAGLALGQMVGMSIPWSPPEMLAEEPSGDVRSDVYSLAATIYSLLARRSPFEVLDGSNSAADLIARIERGALATTGRGDVPESLQQVLARAMARDPGAAVPLRDRARPGAAADRGGADAPADPARPARRGARPGAARPGHGGRPGHQAAPRADRLARGHRPARVRRGAGPGRHDGARGGRRRRRRAARRRAARRRAGRGRAGRPRRRPGELAAARRRRWRRPVRSPSSHVVAWPGWSPPASPGGSSSPRWWSPSCSPSTSRGPARRGTRARRPAPVVTGGAVPAPADLAATVTDAGVVFTWTNPSPEPGDRYLWGRTEAGRATTLEVIDVPTVTVEPGAPGPVCIEVAIVRSDGRYTTDPATGCSDG